MQKDQPFRHHYEAPRSHRSSSQSRLRIPSVDENRTKKQYGFRAFSNSGPWLWNALSQALRESQKTQDSSISSSFSLSAFSGWCLSSSGKKTAPVCATSMALPWMFESSTIWKSPSSSPLHFHWLKLYSRVITDEIFLSPQEPLQSGFVWF